MEDVHWADESSAEVLSYLLRRLSDMPFLVLLTWRPDVLARSSPLHSAVSGALRDGLATVLSLGRLSEGAVARLAASALPAPPSMQTAERLCQETGGRPLLVVEYVEAFRRAGRVPVGEEWQLPGGVEDLLRARLDGLSETTLQVLVAGAVLNRDMEPAHVRMASGRGEDEVVVALEEALARAVIVETDELQRHGSGLALLNHRARCARPSLPARHELDRRRVDVLGVWLCAAPHPRAAASVGA